MATLVLRDPAVITSPSKGQRRKEVLKKLFEYGGSQAF